MKLSFEMLHKSGDILFFAKSYLYGDNKYYFPINSKGEITPLALNGCMLRCFIQYYNGGDIYVEFEFDSPDRGIERVKLYRHTDPFISPLKAIISIIKEIDRLGYSAFCAL